VVGLEEAGLENDVTIVVNCYDVASGGVVVKALRYKPAGREFNSRRCHWNFSLT
jgi:hypothetical protein